MDTDSGGDRAKIQGPRNTQNTRKERGKPQINTDGNLFLWASSPCPSPLPEEERGSMVILNWARHLSLCPLPVNLRSQMVRTRSTASLKRFTNRSGTRWN